MQCATAGGAAESMYVVALTMMAYVANCNPYGGGLLELSCPHQNQSLRLGGQENAPRPHEQTNGGNQVQLVFSIQTQV
jgi:hypothetical protein